MGRNEPLGSGGDRNTKATAAIGISTDRWRVSGYIHHQIMMESRPVPRPSPAPTPPLLTRTKPEIPIGVAV